MKIGILTFHSAENYGASLQCYALYQFLSEHHDVEVVNYTNPVIGNHYRLYPKFRKNLLKFAPPMCFVMCHKKELQERKDKFKQFISELVISQPVTTKQLDSADLQYDLIIAGSDQLWNPKILKNLDEVYFLNFKGRFRRATYAMSMGNIDFPEFQSEQFRSLLENFDAISMREEDAADFVASIVKKRVDSVLDPTLLLSAERWRDISKRADLKLPKKYVLFYSVIENPELVRMAEYIANDLGIPLVYLNIKKKSPPMLTCETVVLNHAGPVDFVYLIDHAEKVVTSSFHGTAFSCIFQKDLHMLLPERTSSRVKSIASIFEIGNRIYHSFEDFKAKYKGEQDAIVYDDAQYQDKLRLSLEYLERITAE